MSVCVCVCVFTHPPPGPKHRRVQTVRGGETWVIAVTGDVTDSIAQLQMPPWPGIRMAAAVHEHPWVCTPEHIRGGDGAHATQLRGTQRQREGEAVTSEMRGRKAERHDVRLCAVFYFFIFFSCSLSVGALHHSLRCLSVCLSVANSDRSLYRWSVSEHQTLLCVKASIQRLCVFYKVTHWIHLDQ